MKCGVTLPSAAIRPRTETKRKISVVGVTSSSRVARAVLVPRLVGAVAWQTGRCVRSAGAPASGCKK